MASLIDEINESFLAKLAEHENMPEEQIAALEAIITGDKKPKAADIQAIFAPKEEGEL